jgi:hypothetical protein
MTFHWDKETYERSISSRCWWFTPYDSGQWNDLIRADDELRQIVEMEVALDGVPHPADAAAWWAAFCAALNGWRRGERTSGAVGLDIAQRLGEPTPVKRWLAQLFLRKLGRLEENGVQLTQLVNAGHSRRRGTRPLQALTL